MESAQLTTQENGRVCMFGEIKIILHRINIDETSRSRFDSLGLRYGNGLNVPQHGLLWFC